MADIYEQYDQLIKSHPEEMKDAILFVEREMDQRNCKFGETIVPTFLKPVFFSEEQVKTVESVVDQIVNILDKVTRLYFSHPELREFFYIDEKAQEIIEVEHGYSRNVVISRPDSFFVNETMRFVEFNCDSPAGCGLSDIEEEIFRETYPLKRMEEWYSFPHKRRAQFLLEALLDSFHEYAGSKKHPNIAIIDWKEVKTQNEFKILQQYFISQGYDTIIADPRDLKLINGHLDHEGFRIDLIYRRVIFRELMERLDEVQDFLKADRQGKVCVVNPLRSRLASNKALLAIMTNHKLYKEFFTDEENHIINRHIPWTRRVLDMETHYEDNIVFLKKHIMSHKDHLVLKPADSYGGKDVYIGGECDSSDWTVLINRILSNKEDWVVQRYVDIPEMNVPVIEDGNVVLKSKKVNINPFVLGGRYAGSIARLSDEKVINVSAGGGLIPVMRYKEKGL